MFPGVQTTAATPMLPMLEQCNDDDDDVQAASTSSNIDYPLKLLKDFRCSDTHNYTTQQFLAHLVTKFGSQKLQTFFTVNGWRQLFKIEENDLLAFFVSVYPDFNDYPLDMLIEWWHRLCIGAGSNWTLDIVDQFVVNLNSHFSRHEDYTCRQTIEKNDIIFIYRRFGIVPSKKKFHDAITKMISCITYVSTSFSMLFTRFTEPNLLALAPCCRLCCQKPPDDHPLEFMTKCPLSGREFPHKVSLCPGCSHFVRHLLLTCPCCHREIVKARRVTL